MIDRLSVMRYEKIHAQYPWLTRSANEFLDGFLKPDHDNGIEWGSGRSTQWFAKRLRRLISVEHHEGWYQKVSADLRAKGLSNIDYLYCPINEEPMPGEQPNIDAYVNAADKYADGEVDFALVDGLTRIRDLCALKVVSKMRPGGLLVVDNVNWFMPSPSISPTSRPPQGPFFSPGWEQFGRLVEDWRRYWTSNGVTDTAMFFKPLRS